MTRRSLITTPAMLAAAGPNPVITENAKPGTLDWQLKHYRRDRGTGSGLGSPAIEGYASHTSVYPGESIDLLVSTDPPRKFTVDIYRTGYYGGKGGRHLLRLGPLAGEPQPVPLMGMERARECAWKASASLPIPKDWPSGVYLAKLSLVDEPAQSYIIFIVKERRAAELLFQCSDFTWQAYNKWPGWDSMYDDGINYARNSFAYTGPNVRVSFDRPYALYGQVHDVTLSLGSGEYLLWEHPMAFWLEQQGYDVVYCSNLDLERDPDVLRRCRIFLSVAHDEYWTRPMYENAMTARDRGVSFGFFSGNALCQELVTYASSVTGSPLRTFARKKRFTDEDELMGVKSYGSGYGDYTVTRADHWMFEGTGMKNGDSIVGLIGWEFHGTPNTRIPGLVEVARAKLGPRSVRPGRDADGWHSSVIYPGPKGNWVFNAGTIWWPEGLASPPGHAPAGSQIARSSGPDERVQRITKNLLQRMLRRFSNPILMKSHYWIAAIAAIALGACGGARTGPPWPVEESIARMRIEPSYTISPFAKEPDVVAPVAMDWDENGRIYVVENPGYPLNVEGRVGRVKILEDTNGDGLPDKAAVFADQLVLPTGVMRWKQGILVTDAPDVWYLEDSNGDGRADRKRKVLTGFAFTNPQHTVNSPLYGLDNWIHLAHENPTTAIIFADKFGDRGSDIRFADKPEAPVVKERGRNIRFRPDTFEIEALSGTSQFGHSFDDWGHHFTLNNTYHARHEVIAARYLKRNPDLVLPTAQEDLPDYGRPARVFPIAPRPRLEMLTNTGEFTSACGLVYFRENLFVAEPAHNLAHRAVLARNGPTFVARRPLADTEFIASTDPWFRPVNFYVGPDGVLYLLDYYRLVIEHPEWMSERNSQAKDLSAGADRGRIYRIRHRDWNTSGPRPASLGTAQVEELVAYLTHPNVWWRRNAQRLLVDRKPPDAASLLRRLFELTPSAPGRVHALWSLEGLGQLDDAVIEKALQDPVAGVKENAIRLAESRPALAPRLVKLVDDPDPRVRFQLLASLGSVDTAAARAVRDRLLERDIEDRWMQAAALSASPAEAGRLFARSGRWATKETKGKAALFRTIGSVIGTRLQAEEVESVLARLTRRGTAQLESAWWRAATLEGMATGMKSRIASPRSQELLVRLFSAEHAEIRRASLRLLETLGLPASARPVVARAEMVAKDSAANPERRADSVGLLAIADAKQHRVVFEELVDPRQPEAVQIAAVRGLGRVPGTETAAFLIGRWRALTTSVRLEAADALYRDPSRIPEVVAAVKSGDIQPWTLAFRHRRQLIMHRDRAIRDAARPLLEPSAGERGQVLDKYRAALERTGNAARGKSVFGKVCAKCHRLDGEGAEVGPDLATVRHQPKQVLLEDILDPNRAISQGFEAYVAETVSGATLDGVLGTQTATSITLRREEGKQDTVARKDIRKIYATNLSAMPGDLEKQVSVEQMADLLEYLKRPR